jgi:uncharacterized membrane protein
MKANIISYLLCAGIFLDADAVWLSIAGNRIYRPGRHIVTQECLFVFMKPSGISAYSLCLGDRR